MNQQIEFTTYIVVDSDDRSVCGAECPHKEFLFQHRCRLFGGGMLKRSNLPGGKFGLNRASMCLKLVGDKDEKTTASKPGVRADAPATKGSKPRRAK